MTTDSPEDDKATLTDVVVYGTYAEAAEDGASRSGSIWVAADGSRAITPASTYPLDGLRVTSFRATPAAMRHHNWPKIEATLERTGLDRLDIVYVHDPDEHWRQAADQAMPALAELRDQGVVGAIGAGMNQSPMLARFLRETAADVVMLAGRYTLLDQSALDDVLPAALALGKSVIAVGVFNSGLLAKDRPSEGMKYDYSDAPAEMVARALAIAEVCERHGTTLPAAAIAFAFTHPSVVNVTLGMGSAQHVARNAELYRSPVSGRLWHDLRAEGLIRPDVPVATAATVSDSGVLRQPPEPPAV